ncbi:MAG: DNA adenine methylase [Patescibacteria group bacterium]|nr:DNA adenine methylase [Patescibacteria group bacterium]
MLQLSPLRYPGSKRKIYKYFDKIVSYNKMSPQLFVEPFVGGGSIFINFLVNHKYSTAIIADKDKLIYSFWKTLFDEPGYITRFISKVPISIKKFDEYRNIANHQHIYPRNKLAEACLFLNRTSFSGILNTSSGPIGGRKQKSVYRINCRFSRKILISRVRFVATFRHRVVVLNTDWRETLKKVKNVRIKNKKVLYYFDPPFFNKARHLYRYYFDEAHHKDLRNELIKIKQPWILSYDNTPEIINLYSAFKKIHVSVPYSINSPAKRLEKELIITPLKLPRINAN